MDPPPAHSGIELGLKETLRLFRPRFTSFQKGPVPSVNFWHTRLHVIV